MRLGMIGPVSERSFQAAKERNWSFSSFVSMLAMMLIRFQISTGN